MPLSAAMTSEGVGFFRQSDTSPAVFEEIKEVVSWTGPGGQAGVYEVTHLKSTGKEKRIGLPDEGQLTLECNFLPKDSVHKAMRQDRATRRLKLFEIIYTDTSPPSVQHFSAYVLGLSTAGGVDNKVSETFVLEITGIVTVDTSAAAFAEEAATPAADAAADKSAAAA
jgi:hypothetical protein